MKISNHLWTLFIFAPLLLFIACTSNQSPGVDPEAKDIEQAELNPTTGRLQLNPPEEEKFVIEEIQIQNQPDVDNEEVKITDEGMNGINIDSISGMPLAEEESKIVTEIVHHEEDPSIALEAEIAESPVLDHEDTVDNYNQNKPGQTHEKKNNQNIDSTDVEPMIEIVETIPLFNDEPVYVATPSSTVISEEPFIATVDVLTHQTVDFILPSDSSLKKEEMILDTIMEESALVDQPLPHEFPTMPDSLWTSYMINPGDFLIKIAKKEYNDWTMWRTIYNWNKEEIGDDPNIIFPYHFLDMLKPAEDVFPENLEYESYIVQSGDNLWNIAGERYGDEKSWIIVFWDNEKILDENEGKLMPGMELQLRTQLDPRN